jgi:hypothetical protein
MYLGLALVVSTITFALSLAMLLPQGMWLGLIGLVLSTILITLILPEIKHKDDE